MRKIYFTYSTGFWGSDGAEIVEFPDGVTDEELNIYAWEGALANAEAYGYYPDSDLDGMSDLDLEELEESGDIDNYTNIEGTWKEYNPEKHDGAY